MINDPRIDPRLAADLDKAESNKLTAYKDSLGLWTIGRGHLLPRGIDYTGHTINADASDSYFIADMLAATAMARALAEWVKMDTDCRRNALIEICFNMGSKWRTFIRARAAAQLQDWQTMASELLNSLWATQVGKARSTRLADYFLTGLYP